MFPFHFKAFESRFYFSKAIYPTTQTSYWTWFSSESRITWRKLYLAYKLSSYAKQGAFMQPGLYRIVVKKTKIGIKVELLYYPDVVPLYFPDNMIRVN